MHLKQYIRSFLYRFLALFAPKRGGVILVYHSISHAKHYGAVTPENFKGQMAMLAREGFSVVTLDELARMREIGRVPPKTVAITFDDGYLDNYEVAYPILKEHKFPATIFVATNGLGTKREVRGESFDILSENQIRELSESDLISIEPHTESHPKLPKLSGEDAEKEIQQSKDRLEAIIGKECHHFAYPFGRHNEHSEEAARRAGISYAYTTRDGFVQMNKNENLRLNRNGVNRTVTLNQFTGIALWGKMTRARFSL